MDNLNEIERRLGKHTENIARRTKARYKLARDLGFTSREAMFLQNRNEETIRALAAKRASK